MSARPDRTADKAQAAPDNPYRVIVELSSAPVVVHSAFKPLMANDAYAQVLNFKSADDVLALDSLEPLIIPEFLEIARDRAHRVMAGQTVDPVRHEMADAQGRRKVLEFHDQRIDWYGTPAVYTRMVDVTRDVRDQEHLSRLTEDLRAALAKAEREQQLRARFLARMSHELRTPLTTIFSSFDLIHLTPLTAKQERYVDMARNAAVHLRLLVDNLFEYARVTDEAGERQDESFSLETLLSELVDRYASAGRERDVRIVADLVGASGHLMRGDRAGLTRIVSSLVENALKLATTGSIKLSGMVEPASKPDHVVARVSVTSQRRPESGQAPDEGPHGGKSKAKGAAPAGSGVKPRTDALAAKGISAPRAHSNESHIAVESLPGGGSAFTVSMEMKTAGHPANPPDQSATGRSMTDVRVLLVEDQVVNQELITEMLSTMGYTISAVDTGEDAIDRAAQESFDIVLMDRRLPGMDGFDTATRLQEMLDACPPIILLTADATRISPEELAKTPFSAFVTKPIDWSTLEEEIQTAIGATTSRQSG